MAEFFDLTKEDRGPDPGKTARPGRADTMGPVRGGIADVLGLTDRPGARTPVDVMVRPEGVSEHVAKAMVETGLIGLGGAAGGAVKVAPWIARVLMSGALGGAEGWARGDEARDVFWDVFLDAAAGLGGEALGGAALRGRIRLPRKLFERDLPIGTARIAEPLTKAQEAYAAGAKEIDEAVDLVKSRLPAGRWLRVPAIGTNPMTVNEAITAWKNLTGKRFKLARRQLKAELNRVDKTGPAAIAGTPGAAKVAAGPPPYAGTIVSQFSPATREIPVGTAAQRAAAAISPALRSGVTRAAIDAALLTPMQMQSELGPALPLGAVAEIALGEIARQHLGYGLGLGRGREYDREPY